MKQVKFQKTIAIDFDNTITSGRPLSPFEIPDPRKNAIDVINGWVRDGYIVIINTMRDGGDWEEGARNYLKSWGINYTYYNENTPERINCYGDARKIGCDILIDDVSLLGVLEDFDDIDRCVRETIGEPYTEAELFEDESVKDVKWSEDFIEKMKDCPMRSFIYDSIRSGDSTEEQIIESLSDQTDNLRELLLKDNPRNPFFIIKSQRN